MDKVETKQVPQQGPIAPADIWRTIAQQSLQSALLLGVVGVGIKALMALAEANKKKVAPPKPVQQPINVDYYEALDEIEEEDDEADEAEGIAVKADLLEVLAKAEEESKARQARFNALFDREAFEARSLLGVTAFDGPDEIRKALRTKLAASALHPDQGGNGEEATKLIAAKNLLIARLKPSEG
jgi:hypothetical protein